MPSYFCQPRDPTSSEKGSISFLFVGLFMILLAFFIVLVSLSTLEVNRAKQIVERIRNSFDDMDMITGQPIQLGLPETGKGKKDAPTDVQLKKAFKSQFQVVEVKALRIGNSFKVSVPLNSFYEEGGTTVKPEQKPFIGKVSAILAFSGTGEKNDVEIFLPTPPPKTRQEIALEQELNPNYNSPRMQSIQRAGNMALAFVEGGVNKRLLGVGLQPTVSKDMIDFYFYIRKDVPEGINFPPQIEEQLEGKARKQEVRHVRG